LLYIFWGFEFFIVKLAIVSVPPFLLAALNALVGGIILFVFMAVKGEMTPKSVDFKFASLSGFLLVFASAGLIPVTVKYIDSGLVALLSGLSPVMSVTLEWLLLKKDRPNFLTTAGLMLGFTGLTFTIIPAVGKNATISFTGIMLGIISAVIWSIGVLATRHAKYTLSLLSRNSLQLLFGGILLLALSFLLNEWQGFSLYALPRVTYFYILYLMFCSSLIGYTAYLWLLKNSTLPIASSTAYVCPLIAVIVGITFGGELFNRYIVAAVICIAVSMIFIANGGLRK
jgi:drug/metabolite transporter (DMT)-like permease